MSLGLKGLILFNRHLLARIPFNLCLFVCLLFFEPNSWVGQLVQLH